MKSVSPVHLHTIKEMNDITGQSWYLEGLRVFIKNPIITRQIFHTLPNGFLLGITGYK